MTRILVTGATGFVGKSLVPALISEGHKVRCAVSKYVEELQVEQVLINRLENHFDWSEALKDIDVVIHLAARVHIMNDTSEAPLEEYCKVNSIATKNLAEQAEKNNVKRFIFLSSIKVNGEFTHEGFPFTEDTETHVTDPYGLSKKYAELYLQEISKSTNMEVVIVRPPLVYGPGVKANFLKMIQLTDKRWPLPFANINNKRSFIFIDNLVSALCAATTNPAAANQLFLVADNEVWSLSKLLTVIAQEMGLKPRLFSVPVGLITRLFKVLRLDNLSIRLFGSLVVSNNKIKEELNWSPPISSLDGLRRTIQWYRREYHVK